MKAFLFKIFLVFKSNCARHRNNIYGLKGYFLDKENNVNLSSIIGLDLIKFISSEPSLNFCSEKGQMGAEGQKFPLPPKCYNNTTPRGQKGGGGSKSLPRLVSLVPPDGISGKK